MPAATTTVRGRGWGDDARLENGGAPIGPGRCWLGWSAPGWSISTTFIEARRAGGSQIHHHTTSSIKSAGHASEHLIVSSLLSFPQSPPSLVVDMVFYRLSSLLVSVAAIHAAAGTPHNGSPLPIHADQLARCSDAPCRMPGWREHRDQRGVLPFVRRPG